LIGAATVAFAFAATAGDDAGREAADDVALKLARLGVDDAALDEWAFGVGRNAAVARRQLNGLLREKMEVVDRCCRLSDMQRQKLQLAGQGDIKRFMDRVEETKKDLPIEKLVDANTLNVLNELNDRLNELDRRIESGASDEEAASVKSEEAILKKAVMQQQARLTLRLQVTLRQAGRGFGRNADLLDEEVRSFRRCLESGLSDDGSLFSKALDTLLTIEQAARFKPVRAVFRRGGLARVRQIGSAESLVVRISAESSADDDLAQLSQWPGLPEVSSLDLEGTNVTDTGLEHLKELPRLRYLDLSRTKISDAGLRHLKGVTTLKTITLKDLNELLSDEAVAELKGALPMLEIHW
jgi:hypothetical protein